MKTMCIWHSPLPVVNACDWLQSCSWGWAAEVYLGCLLMPWSTWQTWSILQPQNDASATMQTFFVFFLHFVLFNSLTNTLFHTTSSVASITLLSWSQRPRVISIEAPSTADVSENCSSFQKRSHVLCTDVPFLMYLPTVCCKLNQLTLSSSFYFVRTESVMNPWGLFTKAKYFFMILKWKHYGLVETWKLKNREPHLKPLLSH